MSDFPPAMRLKSELRDPVDERALPDMWRGIASRRAQRQVRMLTPMRVTSLVAAAAALSLMWTALGTPPSQPLAAAPAGPPDVSATGSARSVPRPSPMTAPPVVAPAPKAEVEPLRLANGGSIGVLEAAPLNAARTGAASGRTIALSDNSRIMLAPGARLEQLASTPRLFVTTLTRGSVTFDVVPDGPRRWVVEAGGTTIEVLGTRFTVTRDATGVHVRVARGKVLVRGEHVPGRVQELSAGGELHVERPTEPVVANVASRESSRSRQPSWKVAAERGDFSAAYRVLGSGGLERAVRRNRSVDELLQLSDVARLSGHPKEAVEPLRRILDHHSDDRRAAMAALSLGRVQMSQLSHPAAAARAFTRAIALGLPSGLLEDAYAGAVEARMRAGQRAEAEATAAAYRTRFPAGRRHADIRRWLAL